MAIPAPQAWLFWDVDPSVIDLDAHASFVIGRVLEHGRLEDVRWLLSRCGPERIRRFFREAPHPELSEPTIALWRAYFEADGAKEDPWPTTQDWRRSSDVPWPGRTGRGALEPHQRLLPARGPAVARR